MSKWKWIAQDKCGDIYKFASDDGKVKLIEEGKPNPNFANTLINLETEDYKINDGILTRITRKTELDKLIVDVKKIDKKAAKWMDKNRNKLEDTNDISCCFCWSYYPKYDWESIFDKLAEMEEPQEIKEILRYRVAFDDKGKKYLVFAPDDSHAVLIERNQKFQGWLTDWIEVEV